MPSIFQTAAPGTHTGVIDPTANMRLATTPGRPLRRSFGKITTCSAHLNYFSSMAMSNEAKRDGLKKRKDRNNEELSDIRTQMERIIYDYKKQGWALETFDGS